MEKDQVRASSERCHESARQAENDPSSLARILQEHVRISDPHITSDNAERLSILGNVFEPLMRIVLIRPRYLPQGEDPVREVVRGWF